MRNEEAWISGAVSALAGGASVGAKTTDRLPHPKKTRGRAYPGNHQDAAAQPEAIAPSQSAHTTPRANLSTDSGAKDGATTRVAAPRKSHSAGANGVATPSELSPQPKPIPAASFDASTNGRSPQETQSDEGHAPGDGHQVHALIGTIVEQHRRRWDLIRARQRLELQAQAVCRRLNDGDKAKAAKLWAAVKKDEAHELRAWLGPWLMAMQPLLDEQGKTEKYLAKLVKRLPVYEWVKGVSGLGDVSFSAIVGECAAPVGEYKSPSAVWKAESDLATLRAENERLKAAYVKYVAFDQPEAAERNTAEPAKTYVWPITHGDACSEIEATDDLAAHLVREILQTFHLEFNDEEAGQKMETIARRYMEKLFTEDELRDIVCHYLGSTWGCRTLQDSIRAVRTIRAGKDGRTIPYNLR